MCCKKKKSNADHIPLTLNQCIDIIDKILFLEQRLHFMVPLQKNDLQQFLSDQVIYGFILVIFNFIFHWGYRKAVKLPGSVLSRCPL